MQCEQAKIGRIILKFKKMWHLNLKASKQEVLSTNTKDKTIIKYNCLRKHKTEISPRVLIKFAKISNSILLAVSDLIWHRAEAPSLKDPVHSNAKYATIAL